MQRQSTSNKMWNRPTRTVIPSMSGRRGSKGAILAGLLVIVVLAAGCGQSEGRRPVEHPSLQAVLDEVRAEQDAPGAILGVRYPDGSSVFWASGLARLSGDRSITTRDPFHLGSISKTFTAAIVLQLREEGLLDLEDPLSTYLPGFPRAEQVSLARLLRHESGLADFALYAYMRPDRDEMISLVTRHWTRAELVALAANLDPWFDEEQGWNYSNTNYFMLAVVIEEVTGATLAEALRSRIFEPLDLDSAWLNAWEPPRGEIVVEGHLGTVAGWAHSEMFGELGSTTPIDRGNIEWGSGGVIATAEDSLDFLAALLDGEVISPESLALMTDFVETPPLGGAAALSAGDLANYYGFGISRSVRPAGYSRVGHGGIYNGHQAGLWRLEPCGHSVALFVNRGFVDDRRMLDRIVERLGCGTED